MIMVAIIDMALAIIDMASAIVIMLISYPRAMVNKYRY